MIRRHQHVLQVFVHHGRGAGSVERHLSGDHVIESGAEPVDVGPGVDIDVPANLLRADVIGRAVGSSRLGGGRGIVPDLACKTHVGELDHAFTGQHQVLGFHVAVNQSLFMGVSQRPCALENDAQGFGLLDRLAVGQQVIHRLPVDELHDKVVVAAGLPHVEGLDDIGMIQPGGGATFAVETVHEFLVLTETTWKHLDGHHPIQAELLGLEHDGHGALPDLAENLITGDLLGRPVHRVFVQRAIQPGDLAMGDETMLGEQLRQAGGPPVLAQRLLLRADQFHLSRRAEFAIYNQPRNLRVIDC